MDYRILGALEVRDDGRAVGLGGAKPRALLAILLLHRNEVVSSDRLVDGLWGESPPRSALRTLQAYVSRLRKVLNGAGMASDAGGVLLTQGHGYLLRIAPAELDLDRFAELVERGRDALAAGQPEEATATLREALGLWRGPPLAEFAYEPFAQAAVAQLEELQLAAVETRVEADLALGRARALVGELRELVDRHPLRERPRGQLMLALYRSGRPAEALQVFQEFRRILSAELGLEPGRGLQQLELAILGRDPTLDVPPGAERSAPVKHEHGLSRSARGRDAVFPLPPALARPAPATFVGRGREMSKLRRLWEEVRAGSGVRIGLITGEPGIGKSRLAREVALEAGHQGAIVLHGSAHEDLLVPYQPLVEALEHYIAVAAPDQLGRHIESRSGDLEPVIPCLVRDPHEPRSGQARPETRRYRLFEAVAGLLAGLSTDAPVVFVLDDLHWADQSSVALLRHALESRPHMRLLILATHRPSEAPPGGPLTQALHRLTTDGLLERVPLAGLTDADVEELSRSLTGRDLSAELVHAIRIDTAGNPFFVQEIVRHISESASGTGVLSPAQTAIPESVVEVVNLRLAPLGEACVRLLTVAAVIGGEFELEPLQRITDLEGEDLVAALDKAVSAGLVLEQSRTDRERFVFAHAFVRRALIERLSRAHRRRIHARVAHALRACPGESALLEIAHHLCEAVPAVDKEQALDYATRAAEKATADLAYAEAVDLFTRAVSLVPSEDERRRTLILKRALAFQGLTHAMIGDRAVLPGRG